MEASVLRGARAGDAKRVAVVQSNYVPWRGYFDLIDSVDEFVLLDDAQYTKRDWRNRNRIKTAQGPLWLTIPVLATGRFGQRIRDVEIVDPRWAAKHWKSIQAHYARARGFGEVAPFLEELYDSDFSSRGGQLVCTYFDENFLNMVPAGHVEGLYSCLDYYQDVSDPFSTALVNQYDTLYPGSAKFTAGSACSGLYRGLRLWEAAVAEAGTLDQGAVIRALDHARIAEGPGGPAEMVPGQHHVRMNMYIAKARNGTFKIVKSLGAIDPNEAKVPGLADMGRMRAAG